MNFARVPCASRPAPCTLHPAPCTLYALAVALAVTVIFPYFSKTKTSITMFGRLLNSNLDKAPMDLAVLLLRVISGGFIMTHGAPKVKKIMAGDFGFADPIGLGPETSLVLMAFAEAICGFLVILGLGTRWAAITLIIGLGVAAFIHHAADPFSNKEKPMLFLVIFVVLLLTGGGRYSLDRRLFGND